MSSVTITSSIKFVHFLSHVNIVTLVQSSILAEKVLATFPSPLFVPSSVTERIKTFNSVSITEGLKNF